MSHDVETLSGCVTQERAFVSDDLCAAVSTGGPFHIFPLPAEGDITIGRSRGNDIRVEDPSVSRRHAVLRVTPDGISITDLGSSNGIRLHDQRLSPHETAPISVGQFIEIGAAVMVVRPRESGARPRWIWEHGYFEGRVEEEVARCERSGAEFAVVRLSLPRDVSTSSAEEAFAAWLRTSDVLARYAPFEYEVLFVDLSPREADAAARRLVDELSQRLGLEAGAIRIGIACYPRDEQSSQPLMARANKLGRADGSKGPIVQSATPWAPHLRTQFERIASSNASVLIVGETGVGKEVAAETIHSLSKRAGRRLLRLNCAALTETLLETELFGHEKGAFTGATRSKPGLFETADGGTVFLDEIGDLPMQIQVKLLRVLEDRKVQRVGALEPRAIDVRFLAATNRDVEAQVAAGKFRQDLYFRINTFTLHIPPLRHRVEEIAPFARLFAEQAALDNQLTSAPDIEADALVELERYTWPGNVRELRNVMERAVVLCGGAPITREHLPLEKMSAALMAPQPHSLPEPFRNPFEEAPPTGRFAPLSPGGDAHETMPPRSRTEPVVIGKREAELARQMRDVERDKILAALDSVAGNQTQAAKMLGISRGTLIKRLDQYGIARPRKGRRS